MLTDYVNMEHMKNANISSGLGFLVVKAQKLPARGKEILEPLRRLSPFFKPVSHRKKSGKL